MRVSSFQSPWSLARGARSGIPRGEVVASYSDYAAAVSAVGKLADADFPVAALSIVGAELRSVERVTARLSYGKAAAAGALRGAWFGALFGLLTVVILGPLANAQLLVAVVALTVGFGALFGIARYAAVRKTRDFASVSELIATRYELVVSGEHAARARLVLGTNPVAAEQ